MTDQEIETRNKLIQAAADLLEEEPEVSKITARRISERAGVALGAINYHFQSKDNLLNEAATQLVGEAVSGWYQPFQHQDMEAVTRLKNLLKDSSRLAAQHPRSMGVTMRYALLHDEFSAPALLLPLLREIFGNHKSEVELRLLAFQLVVSQQVAALRPEAFRRYSGIDLFDDAQREAAMETMVNNLVSQPHGREATDKPAKKKKKGNKK